MSRKIQTNQKHMNQDNRVVIEKGLDSSKTMISIAEELGKDPTTIAKEIKKHRVFQEHNKFNEPAFRCALAKDCHKKHVCSTELFCKRECKRCPKCHNFCSDYGLSALDATVSPLVQQGQSIYMILRNHPEITQCEKTLYNYIDSGALSVGNLELPKKVKYKPRRAHASEIDNTGIFEGRTYKDCEAYLKGYPDTKITEMDTVVGCEGSHKALLTLHFCAPAFMVAFLLDSKEAICVENTFDSINRAIGTHLFCKTMPLIITDRGSEFKHPDALECGIDNVLRTSIYYCDPMASWQKPHCEKNHEYIRKICPQGKTTFDRLTQRDVNLMMSHINSSCRESPGGLTPFALARLMLPKELLDFFGLVEIPSDEVVLTPTLLKGKIEV